MRGSAAVGIEEMCQPGLQISITERSAWKVQFCRSHYKQLNNIGIVMFFTYLLRGPILRKLFGRKISYETLIRNWLRGYDLNI